MLDSAKFNPLSISKNQVADFDIDETIGVSVSANLENTQKTIKTLRKRIEILPNEKRRKIDQRFSPDKTISTEK